MKKKGAENSLREIIAENFPKLGGKKEIHIQEAQKFPCKMNSKNPHQKHYEMECQKLKTRREC